MFEQEDEGTRIGLWVVIGLLFFVLMGVVGGVVLRHLQNKAAVAAPPIVATAPAADVELIDAPLSGDLVVTLFFEVSKADLPGDAPAAVDAMVKALADAPGRKLVLSGFHDVTGDPAFNADLAKQRAVAVRNAVLAAGGDGARVQLRKPESTLGDGTNQEARRVEARLVD
jgi:uncharacterized protein related to proFAR isomerase